jgi:hypothetical protein
MDQTPTVKVLRSHHEGQKMKRLVPIIGLGLGAMASAAIATTTKRGPL